MATTTKNSKDGDPHEGPGAVRPLGAACLAWFLLAATQAYAQPTPESDADDWANFGPAYDSFDLVLDDGVREEWAGPFFYKERSSAGRIWSIPPVLSYSTDPATDTEGFSLAYPALTYTRAGGQYRWQLFQLLSFSGGPTQTEEYRDRVTLFPIYFRQRSSDPGQNYLAVGPFYGHLLNRLMRDEIRFVMFPLYSQTRKGDVVTDNYLYPIFHLREGGGVSGWQFWPLLGKEHKEVTTRTDGFGDVEVVGGHDRLFVLWPFFSSQRSGLGTTDVDWQQAFLPFYSLTRSPKRDATTILWPFFSRIEEREKGYTEKHLPWPFLVFASGEGKTISRVWPFYSHAQSTNQQSDFYMWPAYRYTRLHTASLDRERRRVLFFLYSDIVEKNLDTGQARQRRDFWPFYTWARDRNGKERLQILAPVEPVLAGNRKIELEYSHFWSLWRSEQNPLEGASSQSLLWNLYRHEVRHETRQVSLLFGLFQSKSGPEGSSTRLLFLPFGKTESRAVPGTQGKFDESLATPGN